MMSFKKVLLVYPPSNRLGGTTDSITMLEPLGLEYVAAALGSLPVKIQDMRLEPDLVKTLQGYRPDAIGFTALSSHVNSVKQLSALCKKILPGSMVMVGGQHATVMPGDFEIPSVDLIVRGNGYSAIKQLVDMDGGMSGIAGISYRKNGKFVPSSIRGYEDLDEHQFPRRDLVSSNIPRYRYGWHFGVSSLQTSIGCPFRCNFCTTEVLSGGKYITRSVEKVISELKTINAGVVYLTDDESMIDITRMHKLADIIRQEGINKKYIFYARADDIVQHWDLFVKWKDIGLDKLMIGYETPSGERLKNMNKKITIQTQLEATRLLNLAGIMFDPMFIIDPDYSRGEFNQLDSFVREHKFLWPAYSILTPFPGSRLYREKQAEIINPDWDYFDGMHAVLKTKLREDEFYKLFMKTVRGSSLLGRVRVMLKYPLRRFPEMASTYLASRFKEQPKAVHLITAEEGNRRFAGRMPPSRGK